MGERKFDKSARTRLGFANKKTTSAIIKIKMKMYNKSPALIF